MFLLFALPLAYRPDNNNARIKEAPLHKEVLHV